MRLRWSIGVATVLAGLLVLPVSPAAAANSRTLVVDDDGAQCPGAGYTVIQTAVAAARSGDTVRVCGGSYVGDVTLDKAVNLLAQTPAAPGVDCLGGGAVGPGATVITGAVRVTGTGAKVDGFVVTGANTGITTGAQGSGYQLRRNVVQGNGDFGIDLGSSSGGRRTVVEHNCVRGNGVNGTEFKQVGIIADFGDLRNAVIRGNTILDNTEAISIAGSFSYSNISITGNVIRSEAIIAAGLVASEITGNNLDFTGSTPLKFGIFLGGGNVGLTISSNTIVAVAGAGIYFCSVCTIDINDKPNVGLLITGNTIRDDLGSGISMAPPDPRAPVQLTRSVLYRNTIQRNGGSGIFLNPTSVGNVLLANTSTGNGRGINLNGATGTVVLGNTLTGNTIIDARDITPEQNTWIANTCVTEDVPAGTTPLCAGSATVARTLAPAATTRPVPSRLPASPKVDQRRWPCLRVQVWDVDPVDGGGWVWITVVAPDAPPGTFCAA